MNDLRTVAYQPSQLDGILALFGKVYGEEPTREEFAWWFDGNPVGPRTIVVAEDQGKVSGVLGASFYRAVVGGRDRLVALPLWAVTDPECRGRGIFQRLNTEIEGVARQSGAALELGFTNRMAGPIYIAKLGWSDVGRLRVWARPLVPRRRRRDANMKSFGHEQEGAYRRVATRMSNHFVRDAPYLNWRYPSSPRGYRMTASQNGYAVVGEKRVRGVRAAYVADLVAPTLGETRSLLRRCATLARPARVLLALVPRLHRAAYVAFGFVPTPMTIRLIGKSLDGGPVPDDWHFTLGDTDYF